MSFHEEIFSPLDGDVSLQTRFSDASGLISPILSPTYKKDDVWYQSPTSPTSRRMSIPRKPIANYEKLPVHTNTFSTMMTDLTIEEEKAELVTAPKRGWRFYGTFACLALLNFICAIDATILSVALPVRASSFILYSILTIYLDYSYKPERNNCYRGFLVWYKFLALLDRLSTLMGFFFTYNWEEISSVVRTVYLFRRHSRLFYC